MIWLDFAAAMFLVIGSVVCQTAAIQLDEAAAQAGRPGRYRRTAVALTVFAIGLCLVALRL